MDRSIGGTASRPSAADEEDIRAIEDRFNSAWNRHNAADMVESLAEDAQFVTVNGVWVNSRSAFGNLVERLHKGPFKDSSRETMELQIRFLAPSIAIVHSRFRISGDVNDEGQTIPPREGISTRVVQKHKGRWQTVAVHNTDILNRRH
jgi:uncharacterized protein (TIGR02246 family)